MPRSCARWPTMAVGDMSRDEKIDQAITEVLGDAQPGEVGVIDELARRFREIDGWQEEENSGEPS